MNRTDTRISVSGLAFGAVFGVLGSVFASHLVQSIRFSTIPVPFTGGCLVKNRCPTFSIQKSKSDPLNCGK